MAYTPASTAYHGQLGATALTNRFYESVRKHVKFLDDKTNVRWIALPDLTSRNLEIAGESDKAVALEQYADYLGVTEDEKIEESVDKLGAMCASAFNVLARASTSKHGWKLTMVDLFPNNLKFNVMEAGPSVADPMGLHKAYVSYNFRFAAGV